MLAAKFGQLFLLILSGVEIVRIQRHQRHRRGEVAKLRQDSCVLCLDLLEQIVILDFDVFKRQMALCLKVVQIVRDGRGLRIHIRSI